MEVDRKILVVSIGTAPAVLTSSIRALCLNDKNLIPDEIIVITTSKGKKELKENLSTNNLWNNELTFLKSSNVEIENKLQFNFEKSIKLISNNSSILDDIGTSEHCSVTGEFIFDTLKNLTENSNNTLLLSIAGGRKSTSALMLSCMSLLARNQDRIFHVIQKNEKSHPQLSEISFVRMRKWIAQYIKNSNYADLVKRTQGIIDENYYPNIIIDIEKKEIFIANKKLSLGYKQFFLFFIIMVLIKEERFLNRTWNDFEDVIFNRFLPASKSFLNMIWFKNTNKWLTSIKKERLKQQEEGKSYDLYNREWKTPVSRIRTKLTNYGFDQFDVIPQMTEKSCKLYPSKKIQIKNNLIYSDFIEKFKK